MPAGGGAEGCVKPRAAINTFPVLSQLSDASRGDGESFWAEGDRPGTPTPPPPAKGSVSWPPAARSKAAAAVYLRPPGSEITSYI